jgi:hypothetical protein
MIKPLFVKGKLGQIEIAIFWMSVETLLTRCLDTFSLSLIVVIWFDRLVVLCLVCTWYGSTTLLS